MSISLPSRLSLANRPTPLQALDRISDDLGGPRVWLKRDDLTGSLLSGNKIRKLEFVVAQALAEGCDTLITCGGVQSNHCRATAVVAAQLGLKVCLILREDNPPAADGNLLIDRLVGAEIQTVSKADYQKKLPELFERWRAHYAAQGNKAFIIPTGASDEIGVWGYVAACEELKSDFAEYAIEPKTIIVATGSGGTQAGLTAGAALYSLGAEVIGMAVCDSEIYFRNKVKQDLKQWKARYNIDCNIDALAINTNADYIGPGYGVATPEVYDTIRYVAKREGVILDPVYTGKAFHGLIAQIRAGHFSSERDIVFVHTGGLFGVFPHRNQFAFGDAE
ncbi:MAG: D-cysteine desulfhydrase family protein [Cellvibrionaceae bacterium]